MGELEGEGRQVRMLKDLTAAYLAARRNWDGVDVPDALKDHSNVAKALGALTTLFAEQHCNKSQFYIIEEYEDRYSFVLYRFCKWHPSWKVIEAKKLVEVAQKISPALVKVLRSFLQALQQKAGIGTWYGGAMEYAEDWVDERIDGGWEYEHLDNPEDLQPAIADQRSMADDLASHRHGAARQEASRICAAESLTADQMLKRLVRIKSAHPLIDALIAGCDLLREPYSMSDFDHPECDEELPDEDWGDALALYEQITILWEYENALTFSWKEWLDARYNDSGSIQMPVTTFRVDARRSDWSMGEFEKSLDWPMRLTHVFEKLTDACEDQQLLMNSSKSWPDE